MTLVVTVPSRYPCAQGPDDNNNNDNTLQCTKGLEWDEKLSSDLLREWSNIVNQANAASTIEISRFVGNRNNKYQLIAFSDSSKEMYVTVIYIQEIETGRITFLCSKSRIVNKNLKMKSMPSLELLGTQLAVECLFDIFENLTQPVCISPIEITNLKVFSDSVVALSWLNGAINKLQKTQKLSTFVVNRIDQISKFCEKYPIEFSLIAGEDNPADCCTRCFSYKSNEDFLS